MHLFYKIVKNKTSIRIGMNLSSDELKIVSATGFIGKENYDFLRSKAVLGYYQNPEKLTNVTEDNVILNIKANKNNVTYELFADSQKLLESKDGTFTILVITGGATEDGDTILPNMPLTNFIKPGQKLSVKVTTQDGDSATTNLKLSSTYSYLTKENTKQKGTFSFGEKIKLTAPDDMPFFGGSEINLGFEDKFPLEMEIDEDGKIKIAYNKPFDITMKDFEKKYKKLNKKALWQIGKSSNFGAVMITADAKVCGYGEGNINEIMNGNPTIKLGVMAEIEGKAGYKHYWVIGFVPVKIFVEGSVTADTTMEAELSFQNWKLKDYDLTGGSFNIKIEVEAGAGVGLTEYIYELEVALTGSANYVAKPARKYQKLWVEASGKVQRTALYFFEQPLWKSKNYKFTLFQKGTDKEKSVENAPLSFNNSNASGTEFHLMNRDYQNYASGYNQLGQTVKLRDTLNAVESKSKNAVVKSAVLPSTIPTLVECKGTKYLFWADDISSRDNYNRTAFLYAKSTDGANWSSPKRLIPESEDNTADFFYDIFADNGYIYIVWQDAARQFTAEDTLTDILKSLSIRYAVLDTTTDTVTDTGLLTNAPGCYLYPCTVTANGQTYFAYVHDLLDNGNIGGRNTQTLCFVTTGGDKEPSHTTKEVAIPGNAQITNMNAGIFNGNPYLVCELDTDGDASTNGDREIYICGLADGNFRQITDNQLTDTQPVIADSGSIYWCQNNTIMQLSAPQQEPMPIWNTPQLFAQTAFTVTTDTSGKDTILWETADSRAPDGSVSIFYTSENSDGSWSNVVRFAKTTGTIASKVSAAGDGDSLLVAHAEGVFLENETELKDLCVTTKEKTADVVLEGIDFVEEHAVAGSTLTLKADVTNNGNTVIDRLEAVVGNETVTALTGLDLKPYESRVLEITGFRVPSNLKQSTKFTLTLTAPDETNTDDNAADFMLGRPDVFSEADYRIESGRTWLDLNIFNSLSYEASGKVLVHKGYEDGEVIFSKDYKNLNTDNGYAYSVDLGDYEDTYTKYYVEVTSDTEENNVGNNVEFVYIGYGTGVEQAEQTKETYEITSVDLSSQSLSLGIGDAVQLSAKDNKGNAFGTGELLWISGDKRIANVDQTGLVTAYRTGTVEITAYYGDLSNSCTVTVGDTGSSDNFTVTFDTQGGEEIAPITGLASGSIITLPTDITKEGYLFEGWYTQPDGGMKIEGSSYTVTQTVTLYAHWSLADEDETGNQGDGLWLSGVRKAGYTYTGDAIIPTITVWDNTTPLTEKADYTIAYKNNTNVGKATIIVTGKGNYSGKETFSFDITPANIETDVYIDSFYVKANAKKAQKPIPELYYMGTKLKNNKDFTITYSNKSGIYTQNGKYTATVTGKNNYTGKKTITLTAVSQIPKKKPASIAKATLTGFESTFPYTGNVCKQLCTLKMQTDGSTKELVEGIDYTVRYTNNIKAGTATVTYYGKNGYSGKLKKTYKILPYDIVLNRDKKLVYDRKIQCVYAKGGAKPKPVITFDGKTLREGTDYTLSYKNNKAAGGGNTPCVTINGKGNFKGKIALNFTIKAQDLSKMTLVSCDKVYSGKAGTHKITPKLMDLDGKLLSAGKDFDKNSITYTYEKDTNLGNGILKKAGMSVADADILPAGTQIRITVKRGSGNNYTGTFTGTYCIVKADIKSAKIEIPTQIYTGNAVIPDKNQIKVTLAGTKLRNEDYDIILCTDNVKKGKASITIQGKGNYGGTKTVKFTIAAKGFLWWWRKK